MNSNWCSKKYTLRTYLCVYCNLFAKISQSNATKQIEGTYFILKKENRITSHVLQTILGEELERSLVFNTFKH